MIPWLRPASLATVAMVVSASPRPATQRIVASMSCALRSSGAAVRPCFLAGRRRLDCGTESGKAGSSFNTLAGHWSAILTASARFSMNEWLFSGHGRGASIRGTLPARPHRSAQLQEVPHGPQPATLERSFPEGRHALAAGGFIELPLLGR